VQVGERWSLLCRWVRDDLQRKDVGQQHVIADEPVCYRPKFLYSVAVSQVPAYDFTCEHEYYDYYYDYETDSEYEFNNYDTRAADNDSVEET